MTQDLARARQDPPTPPQLSRLDALSPTQLRLWFLSRLDPDSPVRNLAVAVRLRGTLDPGALEQALDGVLAAHRILRSRFPADDGTPRCMVSHAGDGGLMTRERSSPRGADAAAAVAAAARAWAQAQARNGFDLSNGPLFRAALLALDAADHVLVLSAHRIVCDQTSLEIVIDQLSARYEAITSNRPARVAEPAIDYAMLAERQQRALGGAAGEQLLGYWMARIGRDPPVLDLPADRVRPGAQTFRGATSRIVIDPDTRRELTALQQRRGVPSPAVLAAALAALIHRYTGTRGVTLGLEVNGRGRPEIAATVGPLANTLVLRLAPEPERSFAELVSHVGHVIADAYAHDGLEFAVLVEHAEPERSLSHSPLFQVSLDLHPRIGGSGSSWGELLAEQVELDLGVAPVDLALRIGERGADLACELVYSTDLFDSERIARMGSHFLTLLRGALADPESSVAALPLLAAEERRQLLVDWNHTHADYPRQCVHELFDKQVDERGEAVAVECGQDRLSYIQLERRANQLAARLRRAAVGPDVLVALCMGRSVELLVAALGIIKAGGAYVPLDPAYPADRLAFMLADSQANVVVTSEELAARFQFAAEHVICMDRDRPEVAAESPERPAPLSDPEHLAYVIYTSGSTGKPKGVQIPHVALVNLLWAFRELTEINPDDTLVAVTSLSFDIAGLELFLPLITGARVVIATSDVASHGAELSTLLERTGAAIMQGTPASWRLLTEAGWDGRPLRTALCGGEALPPDLAGALAERVASVWNVYGPTETTIWSCAQRLDGLPLERIPIGRPIANTEVFLLDPNLQPVPVGVAGELYLGGAGVARGYLRRPELDKLRFIPDPFSEDPAARIYRTGDLASYRADGTIDFLGRTDHQVKVRGFRIELGEIEANLVAHPEIQAAVVLARDDGRERRLVAYLVAAAQNAPGLADVRAWLRRTLPDYMLPEAVVALARMPLTPNGKVDRQALPSPTIGAPQTSAGALPTDRDERELAEIWQELLGLGRPIGLTENFFELGGNSLLAARLLAVVERCFHRRLPLSVMFDDPTVKGLGAAINARAMDTSSAIVEVQPQGTRPPLFCFSLALGGVLALRHMVRPLGEDQPVLACLVAALPWVRSDSRIEDIAAAFAGPVLERQPDGPLYLFGHSLGGLVAYELALQLSAARREIAPLTLVDTLCPSVWRRGSIARRAGRRMLRTVERMRKARSEELFVSGTDRHRWSAVEAVITSYVPRPYAGAVTIFATQDDVARAGDGLLGWGSRLTGQTAVQMLPGNHISILRAPHVNEFSARFVPMLREWQADRR
jgi:amino acid adenylation domain-containing protein